MIAGDKAVVFTNNDSAYRAAATLAKAGGGVTTIVDVRAEISPAARSLASVSRSRRTLAYSFAAQNAALARGAT